MPRRGGRGRPDRRSLRSPLPAPAPSLRASSAACPAPPRCRRRSAGPCRSLRSDWKRRGCRGSCSRRHRRPLRARSRRPSARLRRDDGKGDRLTSPLTIRPVACSSSSARPSKMRAPIRAPRKGPEACCPGDGRAGVEEKVFVHAGNQVERPAQSCEHGARLDHALDGCGVGIIDVEWHIVSLRDAGRAASSAVPLRKRGDRARESVFSIIFRT